MAFIDGITVPAPSAPIAPDVSQDVKTVLAMFGRLGLNFDKELIERRLITEFTRLCELGEGRLYVRPPSSVSFARLVDLADELARERKFKEVWRWPNFWKPGTEAESLTVQELDGQDGGFDVRIALYADEPANGYDRLLHFKGLPYDDRHKDPSHKSTQWHSSGHKIAQFLVFRHPMITIDFLDHRDFLVGYIMDLLRGAEADDVIFAKGYLRIPLFGRRTVGGVSLVGYVNSSEGQARFFRSDGSAFGDVGVGFSAAFTKPLKA